MTNAPAACSARIWHRRLSGMFGLVACLFLLGMPGAAADDGYASTVDQIIDQLREDPILVTPALGMGDSEHAHDLLTEAAAEVDLPVYIVLTDVPRELAETDRPGEQAAALLRDDLGDGIYHVHFLGEPAYTGVWGGSDDFVRPAADAVRQARQDGPGEYPHPTAILRAVLVLDAASARGDVPPSSAVEGYLDKPWAFTPESDSARLDAEATRWVATLSTVTGVLVAGIMITLVAARKPLPARVSPARVPPTVPDSTGAEAEKRIHDVRLRLSALTTEQLSSAPGRAAGTALDAAERVSVTGDDLDAAGSVVLAARADRELERITRPDQKPYHPCFVNPLHGEATDTVSVTGASIEAPVCAACAREPGAFLTVRRLGRHVPYTDTSTVWARTGFGSLVDDLAEQVLEERSVRR